MKKLVIVLAIFTSMLFLTACDGNKPNTNNNVGIEQPKHGLLVSNVLTARVGDFVFDEAGRKYVKITDTGITNEEGIYKADVWERVDPLDKNRWYTPTLTSFVWTNQPVRFNSLFRMEGEDYPVF
jgi:hypothetical protein